MWSVCEDPYNLDTPVLLQEYLVGETYAAVHKHIDSDAGHLISLLPITTAPFTTDTEYIVSSFEICLIVLMDVLSNRISYHLMILVICMGINFFLLGISS